MQIEAYLAYIISFISLKVVSRISQTFSNSHSSIVHRPGHSSMYPWDYLWGGMDRRSSPVTLSGWCCRNQAEMCNKQSDLWNRNQNLTVIIQLERMYILHLMSQAVPVEHYYIQNPGIGDGAIFRRCIAPKVH